MARVEMNPALEQELRRAPGMAALLEGRAKAAAVEAQAIAPVGTDKDPHPGQFRDSISGGLAERHGEPIGVLSSDDSAAPYILKGTSDTPAHDTFDRAIEMLGGQG